MKRRSRYAGVLGIPSHTQEKCDKWEYKWIIAKQLFSKSFWESWSYSEALNNPRMFMWNSAKNKLFLPVSLRNNRFDEDSKQENFGNIKRSIELKDWAISI